MHTSLPWTISKSSIEFLYYRIKVIDVYAMSLSFIINGSTMSGYSHFGNNRITAQFPFFM